MTVTPTTLRAALRTDRRALGSTSRIGALTMLLTSPGYLAIFLYRVGAASRSLCVAKILWRFSVFLTASYLSPTSVIGPGCCMPHPTGIVIGEGVVIGSHATIFQNATIGQRHASGGDVSYPVIGDNVKIFAGAVITGGVRIGDKARVGANAVVLADVPDDGLAVGVPARVRGGGA